MLGQLSGACACLRAGGSGRCGVGVLARGVVGGSMGYAGVGAGRRAHKERTLSTL